MSRCKDECKVLSTVNHKFLIEFALGNLKSLGIEKAVVVVGECADAIKKEIGYNYDGIVVEYVNQPVRKGIINALMQSLRIISADDVILQLADEIFINFRSNDIIRIISDKKYDFLCGITYETNPQKIKANYSVCVDDNMILKECTEKPKMVINNLKGTGFCMFNKQSIQCLCDIYDEKSNSPGDLCDYMNYLILSEKKGCCICVADKEFNINDYSDLREAEEFYSIDVSESGKLLCR